MYRMYSMYANCVLVQKWLLTWSVMQNNLRDQRRRRKPAMVEPNKLTIVVLLQLVAQWCNAFKRLLDPCNNRMTLLYKWLSNREDGYTTYQQHAKSNNEQSCWEMTA